MYDICVCERLFPAGNDILHKVYGHTLVGWQVLVAVHGQKAKQTPNQINALDLLVDLLLALVLGREALCGHLWVTPSRISMCHSRFDDDARHKDKDGYLAKTNQILF